jgi:hypothetical protein
MDLWERNSIIKHGTKPAGEAAMVTVALVLSIATRLLSEGKHAPLMLGTQQ